jgi:hypothetical protein
LSAGAGEISFHAPVTVKERKCAKRIDFDDPLAPECPDDPVE